MQDIKVTRYEGQLTQHWQGYIEPEDRSWIVFVDGTGKPVLFDQRDPETGAVL